MCGIAGILYRDAQRPVDPALLKAMGNAIAHRGPDGEGYWQANCIGLVHRRLSIIDLDGGAQPIGNEDGSVQVVFNGEIYNYQRLRTELESRGHRFRTASDTEVLVHLYEERGARLVDQLRGMFAFALWDHRERRLLLARDRVGLKPLYVYRDREMLAFGSELKAILAHTIVARELDTEALEDYLTFGFVPGQRSIFRNIEKLLPGHTLEISASHWGAQPRRYWQLRWNAESDRTLADWSAAIEAKINETVVAHRIADVPVGAFLSGGLDSSVIAATFARTSAQPPTTFTIGFDDPELSELPYARQVAAQFGCEQIEEIVRPDAAQSLADVVHFFDEPFADSSAIPTLLVSRLARRHVKVALSGDGGDEAFGGYRRYAHDLGEARWRNMLPAWGQSALAPLARAWPKADWLPRVLRAKTLLTNLSLRPDQAYANTLSWSRLPDRRRLLTGDVQSQLNGHRPEAWIEEHFRTANGGDELQGMIAADVGVLLPDDFLTKVDRASMACGLEVRPPLVDHELLELAASIPSSWKVRGGETKWIFKHIYRDRLPRGIVDRPKRGFEIPTDAWLRGPLREAFEATVLSPHGRTAEWIDLRTVDRLYRAHLSGTSRQGNVLWSLMVLSQWAETYLPRSAASPALA